VAKRATIAEYLDALTPSLREIGLAARDAIDVALPGAQATIKWAHPTWSVGSSPSAI
jgi:uncharacterized protein YdhG (YjbR/CyaY superfamily)